MKSVSRVARGDVSRVLLGRQVVEDVEDEVSAVKLLRVHGGCLGARRDNGRGRLR